MSTEKFAMICLTIIAVALCAAPAIVILMGG